MEPEQFQDLKHAFSLYWSGKIAEGGEFLADKLDLHPAFRLLHAEEAVIQASLGEEDEQYDVAFSRLSTARKVIQSTYKANRSELKKYVAFCKSNGASGDAGGDGSATPAAEESSSDTEDDSDDDGAGAGASSSDTVSTFVNPPRLEEAGLNAMKVSLAVQCKMMLGECLLWESAMKFKQQKFMKGVVDLKKSWNVFHDFSKDYLPVLLIDGDTNNELPMFQDLHCSANFGLGIFHFAVSAIPPAFRWIVEGVGFKGDRTQALQEFKDSMSYEEGYRAPLAALSLAWIHAFFYFDYGMCNRILAQQMEQFPDAGVLCYTQAYVYRKEGKVDQSTELFQQAWDLVEVIPQFQLKVRYELGYNAFLELRWMDARKHFVDFVDHTTSTAFRAYSAFQLGFCHLMAAEGECGDAEGVLSRPEELALCEEYLKKSVGWCRKGYAHDEFSSRWAKKYLKRKKKESGFTAWETTYLQLMQVHEATRFDECLNRLIQAESDDGILKTPDDKAVWLYLMGSCLGHTKQNEGAKQRYLECVKMEKQVKTEKFCLPWSHCGLAELFILEGHEANAEKAIRNAKKFSDYDFESFLSWRIRKAEDDLARLKNGTLPLSEESAGGEGSAE